MKKVILLAMMVVAPLFAGAQQLDLSMLGFAPVVENSNELPSSNVVSYLESRVNDALTSKGIAHTSGDFVIEIVVNTTEKSLTPTAPPQTRLILDLSFRAVDKSQGVVFNSISIPAMAMEVSESQAYFAAIRGVNFKSRNFLNFIDVAKKKLYAYYASGYAKQKEPEVVPERPRIEVKPQPKPVLMPDPKPEPVAEDRGVLIASDIYAKFVGIEKRNGYILVNLQVTNYAQEDQKVYFYRTEQMIVDSRGANLNSNHVTYAGRSSIYDPWLLIPEIPVEVSIRFDGKPDPRILFLSDRVSDVKVRMLLK